MLDRVSVVITRPSDQAGDWISALRQYGFDVLPLPTLAIEPIAIEYPQRAFLMDLDLFDVVICVSPNAAKLGIAALSDYWPQWPVKQRWIAVGPATGEAMAGFGLNLKVAQQGGTSETLLDWPELQQVAGQRVLIIRGAGGRETLAETLRQRGAQVDYIECYRRVMPDVDVAPLLTQLDQGQSVILVVTSGDGLRNLITLVGSQHQSALFRCPLVVISGRLAEFARDLGFITVQQAASTAIADVISTLEQLKSPQDGE